MILASASGVDIALSFGAAAAYLLPAAAGDRLSVAGRRIGAVLAWLLHGSVLAWMLLGAQPRFGFAPALSVTAWLALTVYAVEREVYPQLQLRWALAVLGAAAVLLALVFPGSPLHPAASPLLPLHWALGIASYGLFAAAVLHAWLLRRTEHAIRRADTPYSGLPLLTLERLTFRFAAAGFVLLTATLLAGTLFSEYFYGRAWRWEHKTVFSVLAWITFALLLLGRARFGWRGRTAVRALYTGSILLLLAYAGSRFVLEVVLGAGHVKLLLLLLLAVVLYHVLRAPRVRSGGGGAATGQAPRRPALPQPMVRCPVCALHLPQADALPGASGRQYCCPEHRSQGGD